MMPEPMRAPPGFDELSTDEKVDYLQSLWKRIAAQPDAVPVPDWHRSVVRERVEAHRKEPAKGDTWDTVRARLRRKITERAAE